RLSGYLRKRVEGRARPRSQVAIGSAAGSDSQNVQPSPALVDGEDDSVIAYPGGATSASVVERLGVTERIGRELTQALSNPLLGRYIEAASVGPSVRVHPEPKLHRRPSSFSKSHSMNSPRASRSSAPFMSAHSSSVSSSTSSSAASDSKYARASRASASVSVSTRWW